MHNRSILFYEASPVNTPGWFKRNYGKVTGLGVLGGLTGGGVIAKNYVEDRDDQARKDESDKVDKNFKAVMAARAVKTSVVPPVVTPTDTKLVSDNKYARDLNRPGVPKIPGNTSNQGINIALGVGAGIGALALARKLRNKKEN